MPEALTKRPPRHPSVPVARVGLQVVQHLRVQPLVLDRVSQIDAPATTHEAQRHLMRPKH
jgi:hypothetical protein